jgi:hypothetical protein
MTFLTSEAYGQRKLDLTRAIELADSEVHAIAFKVSSGIASDDDLAKAKAHRASLVEKLEDLESAWSGSQVAARAAREDKLRSDFEVFLARTQKSLDARGKALDLIIAAMHKVCEACEEYEKETASIRLDASKFFSVSRHKADTFLAAITPEAALSTLAISGVLAARKISALRVGDAIVQHARDGTLNEMEKRLSDSILQRCEVLAPEFETAA